MRSKQLSRRPPLLAAHLCCKTRKNSSARQPHTAFGVSQHEACFGTGAEAAEEKCVKLSCPLQPHGSPLREEMSKTTNLYFISSTKALQGSMGQRPYASKSSTRAQATFTTEARSLQAATPWAGGIEGFTGKSCHTHTRVM